MMITPSVPPVFISHATEDAEFAELLAAKTRDAGFAVWIDTMDIAPGDNWRHEIDTAILHSFVVVVIASEIAANSKYVTYEWAFALGHGRPVIPLQLTAAKIHPRLDILQWLDFSNGRRPWQTLMALVQDKLNAWTEASKLEHPSTLKTHSFDENSEQFFDFFAQWFSQIGMLTVFCSDLEWLNNERCRRVRDALAKKKTKLRLFLRSPQEDAIANTLARGGAILNEIPSTIRSSHRMSILDNDGIQSIIIRNKDVEKDKIVFVETDSYRDPYMISLAMDVIDDCVK